MATVRLGSIVADIRGSVGDETYGRNPGGIYVRNRTSPAQPASADRDATQAALTAISQAWSGTLTDAQRSTWRQYGQQHLLPDRFGRPKSASGICHFIRSNVQRYRDETALTATNAPYLPPPPIPLSSFTVQVAAALVVTGSPTPDVTGTYSINGSYNGRTAWEIAGGAWWIWYLGLPNLWIISESPGNRPGPYWYRTVTPNGAWTPYAGASGTATSAWNAAQSALDIALPPDNYPDPSTNLRLFAYAGAQVTVGRSFYSTPWRYIGRNTYDGGAWTLDPWFVAHWSTLTSPGRIFLRLVVVLSDGATSTRGHATASF